MITITLEEADALQMESDMLLKAAQFSVEAENRVKMGQHEAARICSELSEKWARLASKVQVTILCQRGITEP